MQHVTEAGFRLGSWVVERRSDHKRRKLSLERIAALEAMPGWAWRPHASDWQEGIEHLRAYVAANGQRSTTAESRH